MTEEAETPQSCKHSIPMLRQTMHSGETRQGAVQNNGKGGASEPQEKGVRLMLTDTDQSGDWRRNNGQTIRTLIASAEVNLGQPLPSSASAIHASPTPHTTEGQNRNVPLCPLQERWATLEKIILAYDHFTQRPLLSCTTPRASLLPCSIPDALPYTCRVKSNPFISIKLILLFFPSIAPENPFCCPRFMFLT